MNPALSVVAREIYAPPVQNPADTDDDGDSALARRISTGDAAAEAEFCRRFAPRIRLFGRKWLRSDAAAADLVQDVLLMALQKLRAGAVHDPERIASFMLGTARQMVVDSRRNSGRRERILDTFPIDLIPIEEPAREEAPERLRHCLQALPERERAVLVMTFYDDCPADALGRQLGINAGHVRVIRHRGLEHLRICMEAGGAQ